MKKKIMKSIALSMGCIVLTLTLAVSSNFTSNSTNIPVHTDQNSPYAWNNIKYIDMKCLVSKT